MAESNLLSSLCEGALEDANDRQLLLPLSDLQARVKDLPKPVQLPDRRPLLIAEIKRSSPSKGLIANLDDPAKQAQKYACAGAAAISVLTESRRFGGSLEDLQRVRAAVDLPLLRKDFILNEYQIYEARAFGADLVLLIVAALEPAQLQDLHALILQLGMLPLVEVHNEQELAQAAALPLRMLGVNARDLKTFSISPGLFAELIGQMPPGCIKVAESGVNTAQDFAHYVSAGADAVLVGEALMKGEAESLVQEFYRAVNELGGRL